MPNTNAPYGFREIGLVDGSVPNMGMRTGLIASANVHAIYTGDVLLPVTAGYYDVATVIPGGGPIGGIAVSFTWMSRAVGHRVWRPYWPGNGDAIGDVSVKVLANPGQLLQAQCLLGPVTVANIGKRANFAVGGGGNQYSGISSFTLDDSTIAADSPSAPFKIYGFPGNNNNSNSLTTLPGDDIAAAYNNVILEFNNLAA